MKAIKGSDLWVFARQPAPLVELLVSDDCFEITRHLVRAMTQGSHLVLLDADAAAGERAMADAILNCGAEGRTQLNSVPAKGAALDAWRSHWLAQKNFRLSLFTSGTTAAPKHLLHRLDTLVRGLRSTQPMKPRIWASAYHPAHMAGIQLMLQAIWSGDAVWPTKDMAYHCLEEALKRVPATHLVGTPSFFRLQLPFRAPCEMVEQVSLGGEPLDETLLTRLHYAFPRARLRNIYASTEAGSLFASDGLWFSIPEGLKGKVRILDGELCLHASLVGQGALAPGCREGWFHTGDLVDPDPSDPSRFQIQRRQGEVIHTASYRVDPAIVETALRSLPGVKLAHVYGRENPVVGTLVCADLHGEPMSDQKIRAELSRQLAHYQIPRVYNWLDDPGLTVSGKLARRKMCSESS